MQAHMMRQMGNQMMRGGGKMLPSFRGQAANFQTNPSAAASSLGSQPGPRGRQQACFQACRGGPSELVYVGPGGNYKQEVDYQYVGQGAGEYDYVKPRRTWWLCPLMCCLLLVPLLCLAYWLLEHHSWTTTTLPLFDCNRGFENWEEEWGAQKQNYCCEAVDRGCVVTTTIVTTTAPFHCGWGFGNWEALWSEEKKVWCCHHMDRGCPDVEPPTPPPWVCDEETNWEQNWPKAKQEWCCKVSGRGCPVPEHDCDAVFAGWQMDWSYEMRAWCCTHCEEKVCHARKCIPYMPRQIPTPMRDSEVDQDYVAKEAAPEPAAPEQASPEQAAPMQAAPSQAAPVEATPDQAGQ